MYKSYFDIHMVYFKLFLCQNSFKKPWSLLLIFSPSLPLPDDSSLLDGGQGDPQLACGSEMPHGPIGQLPDQPLSVRHGAVAVVLFQLGHDHVQTVHEGFGIHAAVLLELVQHTCKLEQIICN